MKAIIMGWSEGLQKVQLSRHLRQYMKMSIAEAKGCVDDILENKRVVLSYNDLSKEEVMDSLNNMKVKFDICN